MELKRQLVDRGARLFHVLVDGIVRGKMLLVHASLQAVEVVEFLLHVFEKSIDLPALQTRAIHRGTSG